ncbi:SDH family Clp fold serine proteinase [Aeromonas caviae]|uniref:SDH family Clp fold serine proteinase n=1 Tax=Aeromonas caviae TaxID=648 RepID=UPI000FE400A2|nr:S49 family peptidase [Aeromonas caviae]MBL0576329.1 hypothetical protein [Aeromonas caviae]RWT30903.1 S49 family peptidase [Aeromonas caviae]
MPNFNDVLDEIRLVGGQNPFDIVRKRHLAELSQHTGRNTIAYYSAFLSAQQGTANISIDDMDKNGLMNAISSMDCSKGLDLILHTPGGSISAAESIVYYLKQKFSNNIRAIVPQMAMSAGTMIACSCQSIYMGHQSCIGPFDPHVRGGISAFSVFDEFRRAIDMIQKEPHSTPLWQSMLQKYPPAFLEECENAIEFAKQLVPEWLRSGMFSGLAEDDREGRIAKIMSALNNPKETKEHGRHIHYTQAKDMGLIVNLLENDQDLQEKVLTVHHAFIATLLSTTTAKIIENNDGRGFYLTRGPQ